MEKQKRCVLAINCNEDTLFAIKILLKGQVDLFESENNLTKIESIVSDNKFDVVLMDMSFCQDAIPGAEGFQHLRKILQLDPAVSVLFITTYSDIKKSMWAIQAGATDFILKPWQNEKVLASVLSAVQLCQSRRVLRQLKEKQRELYRMMDKPYNELIGVSKSMRKVYDTFDEILQKNANVLLIGEKGTGRETVARVLHKKSAQKNEAFINFNLCNPDRDQTEGYILGYVKGAFAHAKTDRPGCLEMAHKGTLFIDDPTKLPQSMQSTLSTVIKNGELTRMGSKRPIPIDLTLMFALEKLPKQQGHETHYSLSLLNNSNTVKIELPPLRQRIEDIPLLADHFMNIFSRKYEKVAKLSKGAMSKLLRYRWPGNVQELKLVLERAVILSEKQILNEENIQLSLPDNSTSNFEIETYNLEDAEKSIIQTVLLINQGNISKAAIQLGLTRTSLYRRIEKYGL
ncbi:DNA-binding transcriptional response regulator, NtrC family, contains REC, AAA-type ATPase, and a Fis-type DNA-binding domains [Saccharicrinis carchari]|uniref:DNA-binding transcriptional response regulator, NtrC family, contains REC, AAA-type ATPase, and a Fis-type DNA-binding domains n=1 Tax=Saccharicrinis carchari TaxID=1168039 RepID=A0A521DDW0_SACCC|nr:sigma-54 dependent transcriptional regulator [Saccharicrinis carchari]SMO69140.1 DNA-binding transcriptional response regulator, NtrC family, contains REC, AAA-type ATPase, and a Fis-type DNA-binding domains [Saccharicrinis carchari]